jgi:hypothetical protein
LLAAGLVVTALVSALNYREQTRRYHDALRLVTTSDLVPRRLVPPTGPRTEQNPHGYYRGRAGIPLAVLSLSHFAPPPAGQAYQAW